MNRVSYMHRLLFAAALILLLIAGYAIPVAPQSSGDPESLFGRLAFRSIGPATMGGRVDDLAVLEKQPATFCAGTATGGLWKTLNHGTTWDPVFDHEDVVSIGAVAIPPDDANLVWAGTGENNNRQSSSWGGGVYKSTNGGRSWKNMGLIESRHIGRIVIDPLNHDTVYVAATGHLWGPNPERGVYKTTDGGLTWKRALFVDEQTGATDIVMDPSDNKVLYAAMYQRQRSAWGFNGGGLGSGLYKSTDAGATWTQLANGIPAGIKGRTGLDIYRKDPKVVYALIQGEAESGLYRTSDAGASWTRMSGANPRPSYFSQVRVDPNDLRRVYVMGVRLMISDDEGRNFREARVVYSRPGGERPRDDLDVHAMWIDPRDSSHLILGSDVGIAISYDRAATWDFVDNLPIGQFYHVGYDMDTPYHVYGGLQDNDVWAGPSAVRYRFGITNREWIALSIGDGFAAFADPRDARIIYAETQDGNVARVNRDTGERRTIRPQAARGEPPLRWAWDTPLILSPHDPDTLLIAANRVFRSTNRGDSWEAISPDLTSRVDRETLTMMGATGKEIKLSKNDGVSAFPTIVALAESPRKAGLFYAGADDGAVQVSSDGGKNWTNVSGNFPGLPERASVSRIVASAFDEATAYATFNNHRSDDYNPYVYMTADSGATWTSLASTLPKGQAVNCITEDPRNRNVLYLGTEFGLFLTLDRGENWIRLRSNLPTVPIDEITIHPRENDMLLATHGRSIWILDDITPIQQAADSLKAPAFLFEMRRPAVQFAPSNEFANFPGDRRFYGQNPEFGAPISYSLREEPKEIKITIRSAAGMVVREFSSDDLRNLRKTGLNRTYWDLRHQPVEPPRGQSGRGGFGGGPGGSAAGPFVLPGDYRITLTVDGSEVGTRTVRVQGDPLIKISDADRKAHHDAALMLHEIGRTINEGAAAVATANDQIRALLDILKTANNPPAQVTEATNGLADRFAALARQFAAGGQSGGGRGGGGRGVPGTETDQTAVQRIRAQSSSLKSQLMSWTAAPTPAQSLLAIAGREELGKVIADLNDALTRALPALRRNYLDSGLKPPAANPIPPVQTTASPGK